MSLTLSHFSAVLVFAFFASIVIGITHKNTRAEMVRYALQHFVVLVIGTILVGWLMAALRYFATKP